MAEILCRYFHGNARLNTNLDGVESDIAVSELRVAEPYNTLSSSTIDGEGEFHEGAAVRERVYGPCPLATF